MGEGVFFRAFNVGVGERLSPIDKSISAKITSLLELGLTKTKGLINGPE